MSYLNLDQKDILELGNAGLIPKRLETTFAQKTGRAPSSVAERYLAYDRAHVRAVWTAWLIGALLFGALSWRWLQVSSAQEVHNLIITSLITAVAWGLASCVVILLMFDRSEWAPAFSGDKGAFPGQLSVLLNVSGMSIQQLKATDLDGTISDKMRSVLLEVAKDIVKFERANSRMMLDEFSKAKKPLEDDFKALFAALEWFNLASDLVNEAVGYGPVFKEAERLLDSPAVAA